MVLDRAHAQRAVAAAAGQQNADGRLAGIFGERDQELVDGKPVHFRRRDHELQPSVRDLHDAIGRRDIEVVGLEHVAILRLRHRHRGGAAEDLRQRLSRPGGRWVTITKAMPVSAGMPGNRPSSAFSPPAEAPMPTMGNCLSWLIAAPAQFLLQLKPRLAMSLGSHR